MLLVYITLAVTEMFDQPGIIIEHLHCVFSSFSCSTKNALMDAVCSCAIVQKCLAIVWYLSKLMTEQNFFVVVHWIQNRCTVIGPSLTPYL